MTTDSVTILPPTHALTGKVSPPGSKSITNRALLLAGLAKGTSRLTGALKSDDTRYMAEALRQMGVTVDEPFGIPQRNVPIGLIGSLLFCTVFYILVAAGAAAFASDAPARRGRTRHEPPGRDRAAGWHRPADRGAGEQRAA